MTEIFPVGAAGPSALFSLALHWPEPAEGFFLAQRVGLLLAVMAYFWRDVGEMATGVMRAAKGKRDPGARLTLQILAAAIPTLGLGFVIETYGTDSWKTPGVTAWAIIGFGLLLLLFDRMTMTVKRIEHATYIDAIAIGLCQLLALVPGAGAAAVTMTMARVLGYERAHAVRFALLLAIPVAGVVTARDAFVYFSGDNAGISNVDILCGVIGFFAGLAALAFMMAWLKRGTFTPFVIVRLLLGAAVMALTYGGFTL